MYIVTSFWASHGASGWRRHKGHRFNPWVMKVRWRRARQPTHFLAWKIPQTERSLVGCGPQVHKGVGWTGVTLHMQLLSGEDLLQS